MATLKSFDLNGKKLSFANWVSTLSPEDTPFVSMISKESIDQAVFQWQTDTLNNPKKNAFREGGKAVGEQLRSTTVLSNTTQILRKVVKVSDTVEHVATFGRGNEMQFQMEKASKEIKRDLEWAFLNQTNAVFGDRRRTAGIRGLVAGPGKSCPDTGAVVHKFLNKGTTFNEESVFDLTYNLYLAGAKPDIIMFHPKWASVFSSLQESYTGDAKTRKRLFENTPKVDIQVTTLVDPLGQTFTLIPNRWMPVGSVYFFNSDDFTQMILRSPEREKLAKDGSYEKWMIEMETGLRLRHPFAAGVLNLHGAETEIFDETTGEDGEFVKDKYPTLDYKSKETEGAPPVLNQILLKQGEVVNANNVAVGEGPVSVEFTIKADVFTEFPEMAAVLYKNDEIFKTKKLTASDGNVLQVMTINTKAAMSDSGTYQLVVHTDDGFGITSDSSALVNIEVVTPPATPTPPGTK